MWTFADKVNAFSNSMLHDTPFNLIAEISGRDHYAANDPCEDRDTLIGFDGVRGGAIFDGHGGDAISDLLVQNVHSVLLNNYQAHRSIENAFPRLRKTLLASFDDLEDLIRNS